MEQLLEIQTRLEVYEIGLETMDRYSFSNPSLQNTYEAFLRLDTQVRNEFIRQYEAGELSYAQMRDLIVNYNGYIYYTNKTFFYLRQREITGDSKEIQRAIKNGYSSMRTYFVRVQGVINNAR